jgi:NADPH:quinone reductase-like Zn-dependent oxidoreductase
MKAILWTKYGAPDLLKLGEVPKPVPKVDEVLVKIKAGTVSPGDCELRRFEMHVLFWLPVRIYMGITKPKRPILGMDLAGEIESVGKNIRDFEVGDAIIGGTGLRLGAHAEYTCLSTKNLIAKKPVNISFEDAATLPTAGTNALHYIRKAAIKPGEKILVIGAAGCFGSFAVQLAKNAGAEVTSIDSTKKLDTLKSIGTDQVIDYTQEDFTKNGKEYDIIFDIAGKGSVSKSMKSLTPTGRYVLATPWVKQVLQGIWCSLTSNKKFIFALAGENPEDLVYLTHLIEEGRLKPVIDRMYRLEQIPEAHTYVESGEKIGNVVITHN